MSYKGLSFPVLLVCFNKIFQLVSLKIVLIYLHFWRIFYDRKFYIYRVYFFSFQQLKEIIPWFSGMCASNEKRQVIPIFLLLRVIIFFSFMCLEDFLSITGFQKFLMYLMKFSFFIFLNATLHSLNFSRLWI